MHYSPVLGAGQARPIPAFRDNPAVATVVDANVGFIERLGAPPASIDGQRPFKAKIRLAFGPVKSAMDKFSAKPASRHADTRPAASSND